MWEKKKDCRPAPEVWPRSPWAGGGRRISRWSVRIAIVHGARMGRKVRPRPASCATWAKRNWVLLGLVGLAIAGIVLSVLLLFEPCKRSTAYEKHNATSLVDVVKNVTKTVERKVNVTVETLVNETTMVTTKVNTTTEVTTYKPYRASLLLDASKSVSAEEWVELKAAAGALASATRSASRGSVQLKTCENIERAMLTARTSCAM